jgi:hypothetical protein
MAMDMSTTNAVLAKCLDMSERMRLKVEQHVGS